MPSSSIAPVKMKSVKLFHQDCSTLRGKTRISLSEPNGRKLNLYFCNTNYLEKNIKKIIKELVIILDIFKYIDCITLLWKTSYLASPEPGMFASSCENNYHLNSILLKCLSFFEIIYVYPTSWQSPWEQDPYLTYLTSILVIILIFANQWQMSIGVCQST